MAKYKNYDYSQSLLIPVSLEDQLMPGTLEFAIRTLVETRMDMSVFDENYQNDETGRRAYDPKILLKVVLLAYSRGLISSRQIERACCENITFMAMSCNQRPDHSTIASFVSSMKDQILPLFCDILLVCDQENLLGGTIFALDGLKLRSNASMDWSGKISEISTKKEKIKQKVKLLMEEQITTDKDDGNDDHYQRVQIVDCSAKRGVRWLEIQLIFRRRQTRHQNSGRQTKKTRKGFQPHTPPESAFNVVIDQTNAVSFARSRLATDSFASSESSLPNSISRPWARRKTRFLPPLTSSTTTCAQKRLIGSLSRLLPLLVSTTTSSPSIVINS